MTIDEALQMIEDLNAKHEALRNTIEDELKRFREREPLVQALLDAWYSRHGALRGLAEVVPIDHAAVAVRDFKLK